MTKNNAVIAEKRFKNSGVTRRLWRFQHATVLERSIEVTRGRVELTLVVNTSNLGGIPPRDV